MLALAQTPEEKAFAYGWLSHVLEDSVAHPWVNGFTGGPFGTPGWSKGGKENILEHVQLEGWVSGQLVAEVGGGSVRDELLQAAATYLDKDVQSLIVRAYNAVYAGAKDCKGKSSYTPLTAQQIEKASVLAFMQISHETLFGGTDKGLPAFLKYTHPDPGALIGATFHHYLDLSVGYTAAGWGRPDLAPNLNMDQGIGEEKAPDGTLLALQNAYPIYSAGDVFSTPGDAYVPGGAKPGAYLDECSLTKETQSCGQPQPSSPGGGLPDDTESVGSANAPVGSGLVDVDAAVGRVATKRGERWPALVARAENHGRQLLQLLKAGDMQAFDAALLQAQAEYAQDLEKDSTFREWMTSGRPDPSLFNASADVGILQDGFVDEARYHVEVGEEPIEEIAPADMGRASQHPILFVPTGGLYGLSQSQEFKAGLESYVRSGGTAIVFSQERGTDFSVLPTPDGQPISAWGWFEDQNCYTNGAYVDTFHPILASQSQSLVTSNIDGYFTSIPANAIVLLRRVKNSQPVMFMYPYGQGWVIVSSSYDDWGGYNQSGSGAIGIIRDAIAWAKKPAGLALNAPGSSVAITLSVKNVTDLPASQAHLILMSPSRDRVITEQTVPLSLAAQGNGQVSFSYAFPAKAELGIYRVDYELLDDAGVTIQPVAEEDSGRIVIASPPATSSYRPSDIAFSTVMPGGEKVVFESPSTQTTFHYTLANRASSSRHFRVWWDINHGPKELAAEFDLEGHGTFEGDLTVAVRGGGRWQLNLHVYEVGGTPKGSNWWARVEGETAAYQLTDSKGFEIIVLSAVGPGVSAVVLRRRLR